MTDALHVVFVDDDETLLDSLRRAHRQWAGQMVGHSSGTWSPLFATSAKGALGLLQHHTCAALVTDLAMPGKSGYDLILEVNDAQPDLPCLMLSGTADMADAMNLINTARIFRFFVKPTEAKVLFAAVDEAVTSWQSLQQGAVEAEVGIDLSMAALDRLSIGILVLSEHSHILHGNQAAMAVLKEAGVLYVDGQGSVRAVHSESAARFREALGACAAGVEDAPVMLLSADSDPAIVAHLSPLAEGGIMALLMDPQKQKAPSEATLKATYELTPSEARLAQFLALGIGLDEAAEEAGVTLETARTYLKRIFRKTQTARQSELVRLLVLSGQG